MAGLEMTLFPACIDIPNVLSTNADFLPVSLLHSQVSILVWKHLNTSILDPKGRGWDLDSNRKLRPKMLSESNLLQLQRREEAMSNNEMQLHVSTCEVCCGHCDNGTDNIETEKEIGSDEEDIYIGYY